MFLLDNTKIASFDWIKSFKLEDSEFKGKL